MNHCNNMSEIIYMYIYLTHKTHRDCQLPSFYYPAHSLTYVEGCPSGYYSSYLGLLVPK